MTAHTIQHTFVCLHAAASTVAELTSVVISPSPALPLTVDALLATDSHSVTAVPVDHRLPHVSISSLHCITQCSLDGRAGDVSMLTLPIKPAKPLHRFKSVTTDSHAIVRDVL